MIIRWSPGVNPKVGHYVGTIYNDVTAGTANGTNGGGDTGPIPSQTISPASSIVAINDTAVFTSNLPAIWTADIGSIVAAADSLSATFTAPASPTTGTVTATNMSDPGNIATAPVRVTKSGPVGSGAPDVYGMTPGGKVGRSIVGV